MDSHIDAAKAVMTRHQPYRWLAALRIMRCVRGCGSWPCNHWLHADDERRRYDDLAAIARMTEVICRGGDADASRR